MNEEIYPFHQKNENKALIDFSICGITYPDKNYEINRKDSPIGCIEYVEEGMGTVHIDGKTFYPKEGDSYFLQSKKSQHYYSDAEHPWKKYFVNLSGRLVESLAEGYGLSESSYFEGLDLKAELCRIIELAKREKEDCTAELIGIVNEMLFKMRAHRKGRKERQGIEAEMKDFLDTQITAKFHIGLLCKRVSKSESQTIRIFKKAYGVTPYTYLLAKKIEFAKKLLSDTNLTVGQIADKLCFTDAYYFSTTFKNRTGTTPSAYRKSAHTQA